jgi:hypothetical protein
MTGAYVASGCPFHHVVADCIRCEVAAVEEIRKPAAMLEPSYVTAMCCHSLRRWFVLDCADAVAAKPGITAREDAVRKHQIKTVANVGAERALYNDNGFGVTNGIASKVRLKSVSGQLRAGLENRRVVSIKMDSGLDRLPQQSNRVAFGFRAGLRCVNGPSRRRT